MSSLDQLQSDLDGFVRQARELGVEARHRSRHSAGAAAEGRGGLARVRPRACRRSPTSLPRTGLTLAWHNHDFEFRKLRRRKLSARPHVRGGAEAALGGRYRLDPRGRRGPGALAGKICATASPRCTSRTWRRRARRPTRTAGPISAPASIDWKRLLPALEATRADLLVLEHDNPADFEGFARRSRAAMAAW